MKSKKKRKVTDEKRQAIERKKRSFVPGYHVGDILEEGLAGPCVVFSPVSIKQ